MSKFFRGREGQAAFAFEGFFQPPVARIALAPDDVGCDELAAFATEPLAFQLNLPN